MSRDSEPERRPAHLIVEAGEILRKLTPSRLATLRFVMDDEIETQTEMADRLGISSSTITTDLQTLANLPLSLAQKQGTKYDITDDGKTIFGFFDRTISRLNKDGDTIDWETDAEQIETHLEPLHNSRSSMPFFVLHSIADRSDRSTQGIWISDVVTDVNHWQEERGKSATRKQVRWMLNRFEDAGVIEINDQVTLEEKGQEHAKLLEQLIEQLENDQVADSTESSDTFSSPAQQDSTTRETGATEQSTGINDVEEAESQSEQQRLPMEEQAVADSREYLPIVPAYRVSSQSDESRSRSAGRVPVVPLTSTTTVAELVDQLTQIGREYGDDVELKLDWTLRTDIPESGQNADIHNWISNK